MPKTQATLLNGRYSPTGNAVDGGLSSVVFCNDINLERRVAIKFLNPGTQRKRIFDEVAALQKIRSKNVVDVYDVLVQPPDNRVGIVQEYLPGQDLRDISGQLDPNQYVRYVYQLANGIADIHAQGLIHRDIKPVNVKLDFEKILKIFDFGLAREQHKDARTVGFVGTHGFAAPELFSFGHVEFTQAVDTYAFGVTALYLVNATLPVELTLRPPQPDQWIAAGGFRALPSIQTQLAQLLDACLSGDPSSRPTMAEVKDAFASHLLRDSHRALIVSGSDIAVCDKTTRTATMNAPGLGAITLRYTGTHFEVVAVQGEARINNQPTAVGMLIPGSCVATLGGSHLPAYKRVYVTIDVSHPEVVL